MSRDLKRGILGLIVIVALFFAIRYIRKSGVLNTDTIIYAVFNTTGSIEPTNEVIINGLKIGEVTKLEASDQSISRIKISIRVDKHLNIPANSVAYIEKGTLSPSSIIIERGNSTTYLNNRDVILTKEESNPLADVRAQAKPLAQKIENFSDSFSNILGKYNKSLRPKKQEELRRKINALKAQMAQYSAMAKQLNSRSNSYLSHLQASTHEYSVQSNAINVKIANANKKIAQLHQMKLPAKADSIESVITGINRKITAFNEGNAGTFTTNREMYDALSKDLLKTEILLDDIRINPARYINYSVLGKSSKSPQLTVPDSVIQRRKRNIEFNRMQQEKYRKE